MMAYWLHSIDPFVIKFSKDAWIPGIRWYGVAYLLGFLSAWALLVYYEKKRRICLGDEDRQTFLVYGLLSILIGGRLGYVILYDLNYFIAHPLHIFYFWQGGMASHGGFVGAMLFLAIYGWKNGYTMRSLGDLTVTLIPLGLFFGRLANFVNGEAFGRVTKVPWAVLFPQSANVPVQLLEPRHPSQLYEAFLEGIVLLIYTQFRFWRTRAVVRVSGCLASEFLMGYGVLRIFVEFFREPDAPLILGLSRGQFYSIFLTVGGLVLWCYFKNNEGRRKNVFNGT